MAKATETSVDRTVNPKKLVAMIKEAHASREEISTIAGRLGDRVKNAIDNGHLHRGAFALSVRLYKMDELKREDFIRQMNLYVDICREGGLFGAEHHGDLVGHGESDADDEGDGVADKAGAKGVVQLSEAAKKVEAGIKQIKPRDKKSALDGAEAAAGTRIQ